MKIIYVVIVLLFIAQPAAQLVMYLRSPVNKPGKSTIAGIVVASLVSAAYSVWLIHMYYFY